MRRRTYELRCWGCDGALRGDFVSVEVAHKTAALLGWRRFGPVFYCPTCKLAIADLNPIWERGSETWSSGQDGDA